MRADETLWWGQAGSEDRGLGTQDLKALKAEQEDTGVTEGRRRK